MKKKLVKDVIGLTNMGLVAGMGAKAVSGLGTGATGGIGGFASSLPDIGAITGAKHTLGMANSLIPKRRKR